eukprot:s4508_g8.t1
MPPSKSSESVGHLGVIPFRQKCKDIGVTVRGSRQELLDRLKALGFDTSEAGMNQKMKSRDDHHVQSHPRCPTCRQLIPVQGRLRGDRARGLRPSELQRGVIKDPNPRRPKIKPERFEPAVSRSEIQDDNESDWDNISLDSDAMPESCDSPVEWQESSLPIVIDDDHSDEEGITEVA